MSARRRAVVVAAFAACRLVWAASAAAQAGEAPPRAGPSRVLFGVEVAATLGPRDHIAFFNYTDYEHNALRLARLRLLGEWRPVARVSFVAEVRSEDGDGVGAAAAYARIRPWARAALDVQVGRIPPVIGTFPRRAYGRENPVLGTPLAYQYLTSLRPDAQPATIDDVLRMRARGWRPNFPIGTSAAGAGLPLVSTSKWGSGVEARWQAGWLDAAGAWTLGSPGAPVAVDLTAGRQWSGRMGVTLPSGIVAGVSGARGRWIDRDVLVLMPADRQEHSVQSVVGADVEAGGGPWLVRAEWLRSAFDLPLAAEAAGPARLTATSGNLEARRRLHARWQVAVRLDRLRFSDVIGTLEGGLPTPWDAPVDRVEGAIAFRATRRLDLRAGWQQNWRDRGRVLRRGFPAVQALFWF